MKSKRHTDFYIPVLKVLEDLQQHEVNILIAETADFCKLTEEERKEKTRKGTQLKFESNIQWAITDLCQGGFINRTERGVYTMAFDGLLMLEDNPECPNRDYLEARSEKFRDFRYRKGSRNKSDNNSDPNLFSEIPVDEDEQDNIPQHPVDIIPDSKLSLNAHEMLRKCLNAREAMLLAELDTSQVDNKIKLLKEGIERNAIYSDVRSFMDIIKLKELDDFTLIIEIRKNGCQAYITHSIEGIDQVRQTATKICESGNEETVLRIKNNTTTDKIKIESKKSKSKEKDPKQRGDKQRPKQLIVRFKDGTIIEDKFAANVFAKAIEKCGAERVGALGITTIGFPLIGKERPTKYQYKEIKGGYYIPVNSPTEAKRKILEEIASRLNMEMQVIVE